MIKSLQTMRFFASLSIVQYHLWQNYLATTIYHPGTDFFLVLVGTVAALTVGRRFENGNGFGYIKSRYVRLYVSFIPIFLITLLAKYKDLSPGLVARSFLFLPIPEGLPLIGATWMLSTFLLFYFAVGIALISRKESTLWVIFGAWLVGIMAYTWLGWHPGLPRHWSILIFSDRNLCFIMGYLAGVVIRGKWITLTAARLITALSFFGMIAATVACALVESIPPRGLLMGLPVAFFILGLASLEQNHATGWLTRLITHPWLAWLGCTSYVLYLSHGMVLRAWNLIWPLTQWNAALVTIGAVGFAVLYYIFWEEPVLRAIKTRTWTYPQVGWLMPWKKAAA